jgi:hypothetical protein
MKDEVQNQQGGNNSTNVQGGSVEIHQYGLSYSDVKDIALDVYKANYIQLKEDAAELAKNRAEELTDNFLTTLFKENPEAISGMRLPGMQIALFEAQKQYAKNGDKELEALLVNILVERASSPERSINQIVLDESLSIASKLTVEQMDALTLNFILSKTINNGLTSLTNLNDYIINGLIPFLPNLTKTSSCYEHLEYTGCGSLMEVSTFKKIEELFRQRYPGLFSKGFTEEIFNSEIGQIDEYSTFIIQCMHNPSLLQINALSDSVLTKNMNEKEISEGIKTKLISLFHSTEMSDIEIKDYFQSITPLSHSLFDIWENSNISKLKLTTVGIAIAQANFHRKTGEKLDMSIWIR